MRLHSFTAVNFGSYPILNLSYANECVLVTGPTGAGKSTLFDIPCWILFGITAKNGAVEDVRTWNAEDPTQGTLFLETNGYHMVVYRSRGKASQNDLYFMLDDSVKIRGKDIIDTQRLLNEKLGLTPDIYCAGSYYSEFSPSSSFFTDKAKDRRELLESIVPLETAVKLSRKISDEKKMSNKLVEEYAHTLANLKGKIEYITKHLEYNNQQNLSWEDNQDKVIKTYIEKAVMWVNDRTNKVVALKAGADEWEATRQYSIARLKENLAEIQAEKCKVCGRSDHGAEEIKYHKEIARITASINLYTRSLEAAENEINPFLKLLEDEADKVNPWPAQLEKLSKDLEAEKAQVNLHLTAQDSMKNHVVTLEQLTEVVDQFRAHLLTQAVDSLQTTTNDYLTRFFDSEISVEFALKGSDALDVTITKNGNECNYKQLSKGQRQLLKLTFSLAIMKEISTRSGVKFNSIFLDESLDGMDAELKVKAFNLFCELQTQYDSVMVIDHSQELKTLFTNQINVKLENERSVIGE